MSDEYRFAEPGDKAGPSVGERDHGTKLLSRIGDFVAPLTRFDRNHVSLASHQVTSVGVAARQTFTAIHSAQATSGNGALPPGVRDMGAAAAVSSETDALLAAARAEAPERLQDWAQANGATPTARPDVSDCFTPVAPVGYSYACATCRATGKIGCTRCNQRGEHICDVCSGQGQTNCGACSGAGKTQCGTCGGRGTCWVQESRTVWDDSIKQNRTEYYQVTKPCWPCGGTGQLTCGSCSGRGKVQCLNCSTTGMVRCNSCSGSGYVACSTCGGKGSRHEYNSIACRIDEAFSAAPQSDDPEIVATLKARTSIEKLLELANSSQSAARANGLQLVRDTSAAVTVTRATMNVGGESPVILGFGEDMEVYDYKNIVGIMLVGDVAAVEKATQAGKAFPPDAFPALTEALANALSSEAHVTITGAAAKNDAALASLATGELRGVVTPDYVQRAAAAFRKGIGRCYWAGIVRGPLAALALPVLTGPIQWLWMQTAKDAQMMMPALVMIVLLAFAGAAGGHFWVVARLQRKLAPGGTPKVGKLIDKLNLTRNWLLASGLAALILPFLFSEIFWGVFFPGPR